MTIDPTERSRALRAWRLFLTAHATVAEVLDEELQAERQMPLTWYDVLVNLDEAPGGRLRMQHLANAVLFSRSGLTRLVDRMAHEGLIAREACPDDRRGTFAVLTTAGKRALRRAAPVHHRGITKHFTGRLDDADIRSLESILSKVLEGSDHPRAAIALGSPARAD